MTEDELQQQLTAAEEQLAEMQEALKLLVMSTLHCPDCGLIMESPKRSSAYHLDGCIVAKALSAAPKRGRVILERRLSLSKIADGVLQVRLGLGELQFTKDLELGAGAMFTVTVREADDGKQISLVLRR